MTRLEPLAESYTSPGFTDERIELFMAEVEPDPTPDASTEDGVELVRMPFAEALGQARSGAIKDLKTVAGLLLAEQHHRSEA